ncbi:hypothetical protein HYR99_02830 [Candidatus Poribacteria bacterium]|nr:hypothetical protein [Candidatus Poribacteria bacterium]
MMENDETLQRLHQRAQEIARDYISQRKKWHSEEYRFESLGINDKEGCYILYVVHRDDERLILPVAGKSVELHINLDKKRVIRELHEQ